MKTIGIVMREELLDGEEKWFINNSYKKLFQHYGWNIFPIINEYCLPLALSLCDALCVPGGYDVSGFYFHTILDSRSLLYDSSMDHFDFACIDAFYKKQKKILGICRGMQLLNIYFHGTILQHMETKVHETNHKHKLIFPEDSILHQVYPHHMEVNSYHHQIVDRIGDKLSIIAYSEDGRIEAFQNDEHTVLAVQWHPEKMYYDPVIPYFLDVICR